MFIIISNKHLFVSLLLLLVMTGSGGASQLWVRNDGNDTCNGQNNFSYAENTTHCATQNISRAITLSASGDSINVTGGIYNEKFLVPVSNTTIQANVNDIVILNGTGLNWTAQKEFFYLSGKTNVTINGFSFLNGQYIGIYICCGSSYIYLNNGNYTNNTGSPPIYAADSSYIYSNANKVDIQIPASASHIEEIKYENISNGRINNSNITNGTLGECIVVGKGSHDVLVDNNIARNCHGVGIYLGTTTLHSYNLTATDNIVYYNDNVTVGNGFAFGSESAGGNLSNATFKNNIVYDIFGSGVGGFVVDRSMTGNMSDLHIISNTAHNASRNIWVVANKIFDGLEIINNIASNGSVGGIIISNTSNVTNLTFKHNLVQGYKGAVGETNGTYQVFGDPLFSNITFGYYDFHLKSQYGRWNGTGWENDTVTSPAIYNNDWSLDYSNEPIPNGLSRNMGAYGNTIYASKYPPISFQPLSDSIIVNITNYSASNFSFDASYSTTFNMSIANDTFIVTNGNLYYIKKDNVWQQTVTASNNYANFTNIISDATESSYEVGQNFEPPKPRLPGYTNGTNLNGTTWVNHTWSPGVSDGTDSFNVSHNGTWTNGSANLYFNATINYNDWSNITIWAYNVSGTGTLSSESISQNVKTPYEYYKPPTPTSLSHTNGTIWVNHTWSAGSGNISDSFNVSHNGTWTNGSLNYFNVTVGWNAWSNITIRAYNISGVGALGDDYIYQNILSSPFTPSNPIISCIGWCFVTMNYTNQTLLQIDNNYTTDTVQSIYNSTSQKYETHTSGYKPYQNSNVVLKQGYAIYFKKSTNINIDLTSNPNILLKTGWNLVGNMQDNRTLLQLKTSVGVTATAATHFNNSLKSWKSSDSEMVNVGESFMVYVDSNTVWGG